MELRPDPVNWISYIFMQISPEVKDHIYNGDTTPNLVLTGIISTLQQQHIMLLHVDTKYGRALVKTSGEIHFDHSRDPSLWLESGHWEWSQSSLAGILLGLEHAHRSVWRKSDWVCPIHIMLLTWHRHEVCLVPDRCNGFRISELVRPLGYLHAFYLVAQSGNNCDFQSAGLAGAERRKSV